MDFVLSTYSKWYCIKTYRNQNVAKSETLFKVSRLNKGLDFKSVTRNHSTCEQICLEISWGPKVRGLPYLNTNNIFSLLSVLFDNVRFSI